MPLILPPGPFAAYLFDCDGTITDSMPLHYVAWSRALAEWSCPFPEEQFYAWGGKPVPAIIAELNQLHGLSMPVAQVAERKEALFLENIAQLQAIPEVLEVIHAAHGSIPFAVVSGSPRESVEWSLDALGIRSLFPVLVCAGDYKHGKPSPEPFLLAAKRLGVKPSACLVFEDADLGIEAATAAGMASVKIEQPVR